AFRLADPNLAGTWFPVRQPDYPFSGVPEFVKAINDLMDKGVGGVSMMPAIYETLQTPFDLASDTVAFNDPADGDFVLTPGCGANKAGCSFPGSNGLLKNLPPPVFASRFRGFLLIPEE